LKSRVPLVLIVALAAFAIPAGSAFASTGTFVRPTAGATISQNQTLTVDTTNVPAAVGVDFFVDNAGTPGMYIGGYSIQQSDPTSDQAAPYSSNGSVDSYQLAIGGWDDGPLTFDAVLIDNTGAQIAGATVSQSVTIDNSQTPLVRGSFFPSSSSGVRSGTFTLTLTPSDPNNVITAGSFSVDGGATTHPLTSTSPGYWSAPIDTVALGVPNGALDIQVHLEDAAGNMSDSLISYTIGNPQAPVITEGTLVAEKADYRTDETQLEVGDVVNASNMQATGYPAPTMHYLWNVCRGQVCNGITPGPDGNYTVQAADEGADLTLVATASNGVGRPDFRLVDFGVIAPAYVAPVDNGGGNAPQADPTPAPPVVTPPVVTPPVVTPPVVTPAEQKAIDVAQLAVQSTTAAVEKAVKAVNIANQAVKVVQKKVDVAVNTVSAGTATLSEKQKLFSTVATLVAVKVVASSKVEAAKAVSAKAVVAQKASVQTVDVAQKAVVAAKTAVATGAATPAETKHLVKTESTLVAAKAVVSAKTTEVATVTKQLVVTQAAADQSVRIAQTNVSVALTAIASSKATPTAKNDLLLVETKLATAKAVASAKVDAAQAAKAKLTVVKQTLATKTTAALKP